MKTIAIIRVYWTHSYDEEGEIRFSECLSDNLVTDWREVSDEEFKDMLHFVRTQWGNDYRPRYLILEKADIHDFDKDFLAWKKKDEERKLRLLKGEEKREKQRQKKAEQKRIKDIEKAKKLLEEAGIK